jgi:hypothetical protein
MLFVVLRLSICLIRRQVTHERLDVAADTPGVCNDAADGLVNVAHSRVASSLACPSTLSGVQRTPDLKMFPAGNGAGARIAACGAIAARDANTLCPVDITAFCR